MACEIPLEIAFDRRAGATTPVKVELDFGRMIDPHTLVARRRVGGREHTYAVQFDEGLYYGPRGWVAWLVDDPAAGGEWRVEATPRAADGGLAAAPYLPPVGVGDEIHYNGDRWQPIAAPGRHAMPLTVDWDGDGLVDVLCASHHANGLGMPWGGVFFWRNIGSNREPRFAPPMRLYADGVNLTQREYRMYDIAPQREFISEDYLGCDVFDWFGSGRPDLITISQRGGIRVYRNTGARDAAGLPSLEMAATVPFPPLLAAGRYLQIKVRDWDGSGRPSLIIGSVSHDKETHLHREQIVLLRNTGRDPATGDWAFSPMVLPISGARIGHDVRIADPEFSNFSNHRALSIDVFDVDGDGMLELLCCHVLDLRSPIVELWRNVGSVDEPAMMNQGQLPWSRDAMAFGFHFAHNAAFHGCIRASWYDDYGFRYFEQVGSDPFAAGSFRDAGALLGEACKVKHEGMVKGDPIDPRGSGAFDLVCGDLAGYFTLVRNTGTAAAPAFTPPERIRDAAGEPVRIYRESILHDNNSERNCGQLKPFLCDWDGDGRLDLIVGNNTNRIFWLEGYDPRRNRIAGRRELAVRGMIDPFGFRKGPAVVDFDGDGRMELITVDSLGRISVFHQGGGADGTLVLEPPVPLTYRDGGTLLNSDIGRGLADTDGVPFPAGLPSLWREPSITLAACDWHRRGVFDLFVSSNWYTFLLENSGTRETPRFERPRPLRTPDGKAHKLSQHESHVTACDWNHDGAADLIIGGESGGLYLFHHDWLSGIAHRVRVPEPWNGGIEPSNGGPAP